ncbi:MAG TPA: hypothetical protein IGS40_16285 [Trichormus sp. M33_DOE_039]|nr:hypothetical protein [Trichormus sp. M33_DOE_039]
MKPNLGLGIGIALISFLNVGSVQAITLSFEPEYQEVLLGNTVDVDIKISDLGDDVLGSYDLTVEFDADILEYQDHSFGTQLGFGDQNFPSLAFLLPSPNENNLIYRLNLYEISSYEPDFLNVNQDNDFILFTLTFKAIQLGISPVKIVNEPPDIPFILGDAYVSNLPVNIPADGSVKVTESTPIPEASTIPIPIVGIIMWFLMNKYRKSKNIG